MLFCVVCRDAFFGGLEGFDDCNTVTLDWIVIISQVIIRNLGGRNE